MGRNSDVFEVAGDESFKTGTFALPSLRSTPVGASEGPLDLQHLAAVHKTPKNGV